MINILSIPLVIKYRQVIKYVISGGTAALVELSLLYFFTDIIGFWYLFSASLAFMAAFFISFFLQKFWTFRDANKEAMYSQLKAYLALAMVNLGVNAILMYALVDGLRIWYMHAQVIAGGVIAFGSYLINKFFIFNKKRRGGFLNSSNSSFQSEIKVKGKILIATGIYPPDIGGPATLLSGLPRALRERGFSVKILTYSDIKSSEEELAQGVFRVLRKKNYFLRHLSYFWSMAKLLFWCDLVYVTDLYSSGQTAYWSKKLFKKKYIARFAGDSAWEKAFLAGWTKDNIIDFQEKKQTARLERLKIKRREILKNADCVIAVSNFMAELARKIGVKQEKTEMIYNSVDFFSGWPKREESERPILVFAGRLVPWKDQAIILRIVDRLKNKYPDINFKILGDGPEMENIKKKVKDMNLSSWVRIHGRLSEAETHEIFSQATIFVLNTNYEGLPHSVLNAMQSGLPIITTPVGGNPEVVANNVNGLLAPYNDEAAWQEAIEKLLSNPDLRRRLAKKAKETLADFSWEKLIEKTVGIFEKLL